MAKLITEVKVPQAKTKLSLSDKILILGSCFSDEIGSKLQYAGFNVCCNPFGTLYNPESILSSLKRISTDSVFEEKDCVQMGSGSDLYCSFAHHTSFARKEKEEFLKVANEAVQESREFWKECNKVIVTLGTAMVWKLISTGEVVSNCLKRPACEFSHEMLETEDIIADIKSICTLCGNRDVIFTVSPIRHLGDGAHLNQISKSSLLLSLEKAKCGEYFPAYEILLDELRDYRFYADDLVHPSKMAVEIIWERFLQAFAIPEEIPTIEDNLKKSRLVAHRPHFGGK